jgi:hypothetical protein
LLGVGRDSADHGGHKNAGPEDPSQRVHGDEPDGRLDLVATAAALRFSVLRSGLFLDADEPETATVLANDPRPLNAFGEAL